MINFTINSASVQKNPPSVHMGLIDIRLHVLLCVIFTPNSHTIRCSLFSFTALHSLEITRIQLFDYTKSEPLLFLKWKLDFIGVDTGIINELNK